VAARRLVIVMLVLLAISTLAAALVPAPEERRATRTQTDERTSPPPHEEPAGGELLEGRIDARRGDSKQLRAEVGDQIALTVRAPFGDEIEIPAFGLIETVDRFDPARFDIFTTRRGAFAVRAVDTGRVLGRIVVGARGSGRCGVSMPLARRGREPARVCSRRGARESKGDDRSARRP
jgi:hypothetical protein